MKHEREADEYVAQRPEYIRIAHDLIVGVLMGEFPFPCPTRELQRLEHYAEVLCWVLGHREPGSAGQDFADRLVKMCDYLLANAPYGHGGRERVN